ncbi:hypothetical protein [Pseudomonas mucidolens]|uniref:Uncharacterized protein n=1 Tax=Pseudomonas mucidolens TaxID=46679 RepID=A0A1H2NGR5_9PSED|nr:hypothetical protein [Pseudomonas mucidolens]SDV04613.1 hypothetical protein SAMN05216202_3700 [Pseudomonas mucidolens]SQH31961.1 Uncharacterised protein [Pseudomonas mucidolens]
MGPLAMLGQAGSMAAGDAAAGMAAAEDARRKLADVQNGIAKSQREETNQLISGLLATAGGVRY